MICEVEEYKLEEMFWLVWCIGEEGVVLCWWWECLCRLELLLEWW